MAEIRSVGMRSAFLGASDSVRPLLDHPDLDRSWEDPSPLEAMSVAELCGHLARAVIVVESYLESSGLGTPVDAPGYFLAIEGIRAPDLRGERASAIRARGGEQAAGGPVAVRERWDLARTRLHRLLADEDGSRQIAVLGLTIAVDDYLTTRLVELVVHADDLAVGLGTSTPTFHDDVIEAVLSCLWTMARRSNHPLGIVRAMTRVERDTIDALRVL